MISREPGATAVAASAATSWRAIERDPATRTLRLPPGLRLDLGGVAKGWAADRAVADLAAHGPALVDAGGDIAAGGASPDWVGWPIGVADPRRPAADLALLRLREGGVATSGQDYRRWRRDGGWQHHLIDPRTGRPAQTDVLSATVVGPSAAAAEAAAKAVLLLGVAAGLAWLEARPELAALVIDLDGRAWPSCRFEECLWR